MLAANHPERVEAAVFIGPNYPGGGQPVPERTVHSWGEELDTEEGWAKHNHHYWLRDFEGYLEFFMSRMFSEPHSTKPIEDGIGWGLETTPRDAGAHLLRALHGARGGTRAGRAGPLPGAGHPR